VGKESSFRVSFWRDEKHMSLKGESSAPNGKKGNGHASLELT